MLYNEIGILGKRQEIKDFTMQTIAIIDDDIYIGNMLEEVLGKNGYAVQRAYSGTEALYLLERN